MRKKTQRTTARRGGKGNRSLAPTVKSPDDCTAIAKADDWPEFLQEVLGIRDRLLGNLLLSQAVTTIPEAENEEQEDETMLATVAALKGIAPRDDLERMLAVQMVAVHNLAMQALESAHLAKTYPQWQIGTNLAVKLLRTFRSGRWRTAERLSQRWYWCLCSGIEPARLGCLRSSNEAWEPVSLIRVHVETRRVRSESATE